jgi:hypothetical protein
MATRFFVDRFLQKQAHKQIKFLNGLPVLLAEMDEGWKHRKYWPGREIDKAIASTGEAYSGPEDARLLFLEREPGNDGRLLAITHAVAIAPRQHENIASL